jgi:Glycosyl hydrolase family 12
MPNGKWLPLLMLVGCQAQAPIAMTPEHASPPLQGASESTHAVRAPGRTEPGVTSDCVDYSITTQGPYQYQNNTWAQDKAKGPFEQCVVSRKIAGKTQLGWTWNWPGYDKLGFGEPEIIFGWKPWADHSTTPLLPLRISDVRQLTVRYAVATAHTGKVALSLSLFVTDSSQATAPNPRAIVDEIVVWLDYPEDESPVGTRAAELEVAGVGYEVWHTPNQGGRGDGMGWDLYYFKGPNQQLHGALQVQPFLDALLKKNLINGDRFVASVQLGNELMSGSGTTWVQDFGVVLNP